MIYAVLTCTHPGTAALGGSSGSGVGVGAVQLETSISAPVPALLLMSATV